ncbi:MAG: beta strand repeat-containing protein, partial [Chthoniobacterales bacterium]
GKQGGSEETQPNKILQIGVGAPVGAVLSNDGILRASGSGTLRIHGFGDLATVTNTGGTITATDNAKVRVASSVTVTGGILTTAGNGTIGGDPTGGLFKDIVSSGTMGIADGESIQLGGTFTNNGLIRLTSTGSGAILRMANNTTLNGTGTVSLSDNGTNYIAGVNTGDAFTIGPGMTVQGSGSISPGGSGGLNVAKVTNQGLIVANLSAGLAIRVENDTNSPTPLTNSGTLRAANGSTLTIYGLNGGGKALNAGGTMEALDLSTFRISSNVTLEGGTITTRGSGVFRGPGKFSNVTNNGTMAIGTNEILFLAGNITNNGTIKMENALAGSDVTLRISGDVAIVGNGTISTADDMSFNKIDADAFGSTLTLGPGQKLSGSSLSLGSFTINFVNQGLIEVSTPTQGIDVKLSDANNHSNFTNASTGIVRAANGRTLRFSASGLASVTNNGGRLEAINNGLIQFAGASYTQTAGTFDLQDGKVETQLGLDINGGSLVGNGTITGPVRNNGGMIGPGHSPGTITITGNYIQGANGVLTMEIGGTTPGTGYDQLVVGGGATLGGTLNITAINGFKPAVGDIYTLISAGSFAGSFATVNISGFTGRIDYSSNGITLTITSSSALLLNISTRMKVLDGDRALIGGFIVTGSEPKKVLIRGIGPSLPLDGKLQDPTLELFNLSNTSIGTNDNWKSDQQAEIEATTIPPTNDLESAMVRTLAPGNYTVVLRGKNNGTGIGLVEAYDLAQGANSKLANISTRGFIDTGDNVMIGGMIIGGGSSGSTAKVLIRAIGPSLGAAGVSGSLQDPTLELRDANAQLMAQNDNWKSDQEQAIRDTTIPPSDDRESAMVQTLTAGNYTAIVRGKGDTTGVGLVEVYNLQ